MTPDGRVRVLHVLDRLDDASGGGERAALGLALELPKDRYDVHLCTMRHCGGAPLAALREAGVTVHVLERGHRFDVAGHLRLLALVHHLHPDVLHAHMYASNVPGSLFGRIAGVPVVVAHEQTWDYEGDPLRKVLDAVVGQLADAFIAVSSADARRMARLERVPGRKIHMFPNAWAPRAEPAVVADLRAALAIPADAPVVAALTVMRPQKRLDVMIAAFRQVRDRLPAAHLVIGGDGGERRTVEAAIAAEGLQDAVHLLGFTREIQPLWRASDLVLLSSDYEGTPLAIAEAMAAGLPVVSTDVGGLPDMTTPDSAILVPRRDPAALADAVVALLGDEDRRWRMGEAAREQAASLTSAAHAEKVAALYEQLLAARG